MVNLSKHGQIRSKKAFKKMLIHSEFPQIKGYPVIFTQAEINCHVEKITELMSFESIHGRANNWAFYNTKDEMPSIADYMYKKLGWKLYHLYKKIKKTQSVKLLPKYKTLGKLFMMACALRQMFIRKRKKQEEKNKQSSLID